MSSQGRGDTTYTVVVNSRGQYSIWPAHRVIPPGWNGAGRTGTRHECLAWIEEAWSEPWPGLLHAEQLPAGQERTP